MKPRFFLLVTFLGLWALVPTAISQTSTPTPNVSVSMTSSTGFSSIEIEDIFGLSTIDERLNLGNEDPRIIVASIINVLLGFLGIITVIMVLWSGVLWLFSFGNEEKTTRAKRTLLNTIIGLTIILAANSIVVFIINTLTSSSSIPSL